jgi:hypothetical protein
MTAAATQATFSDFRIVKGRKVAQLVFELPLEGADAALAALGGLPQPATERWFAIARLTKEAARKPDPKERYAAASEGEQAVTRSNLLTGDKDFLEWCSQPTPKLAGDFIRGYCKIASRADLATDADALARFLEMETRYRTETRFGPHATR